MPRVTIQIVEGRTMEQKRALVKGVTDVIVETLNAPPENVTIYLEEMKVTEFAKAGKLWNER